MRGVGHDESVIFVSVYASFYSESLFCGNPDVGARLLFNDHLHLCVHLLQSQTLDNSCGVKKKNIHNDKLVDVMTSASPCIKKQKQKRRQSGIKPGHLLEHQIKIINISAVQKPWTDFSNQVNCGWEVVTNRWSIRWTLVPVWQLCQRSSLPAPQSNACSSLWRHRWGLWSQRRTKLTAFTAKTFSILHYIL